ncbi:TetR/AcrR family transcriptional regulator [Streptodolium elevatio]
MTARTTPGPRERLLDAARQLTYTQGMGVGIDAILKSANVARRSLYEHFGGKDGLITEVLRRTAVVDVAAYRTTMDAAGDHPRARLLAVFDRLGEVADTPAFRGCRYLAADLALADPDHPGHAVTREYREDVHQILEHELVRLEHPRPGHAADQLQLLIDGLLVVAATRPGSGPAAAARELAERVVDEGRRAPA